jgi:hypothetical protein
MSQDGSTGTPCDADSQGFALVAPLRCVWWRAIHSPLRSLCASPSGYAYRVAHCVRRSARVVAASTSPPSLVGSLTWTTLYALIGYAAGEAAVRAVGHLGRIGEIIGAVDGDRGGLWLPVVESTPARAARTSASVSVRSG